MFQKPYGERTRSLNYSLTVEKKPFVLVITYLGSIILQPRTKLKESLANVLNCCKLQVVSKNKTTLGTPFSSKIEFPKMLLLVLFICFSVDFAISTVMVNIRDN